jgi:Flp pilus assembly protein TadD
MASHADRMKLSQCFMKSEMTCITCHNPHVSVKFTPEKTFNDACEKCHQSKNDCKLSLTERKKSNNNCFACHMPLSNSIDIPHVQIHDHFIRVPKKVNPSQVASIRKFVRLACVSDGNPSALIRAKAYLNYFEEYEGKFDVLLDSAKYFLEKCSDKNQTAFHQTMIRFLFLKNDLDGIKNYAATNFDNKPIADAWTDYRIGEALLHTKDFATAILFLQKSVALKPNEIDFANKLGIAYLQNNQTAEAENVFKNVLAKNKNHVSALTNLGFINTMNGDLQRAEIFYKQALQANPDYEQALMNYAALQNLQHHTKQAIELLQRILKKDKNNAEAKMRLAELRKVY